MSSSVGLVETTYVGSVLYHLAKGADVPAHEARRCLRHASSFTPGQRRFLAATYRELTPEKVDALIAAVVGVQSGELPDYESIPETEPGDEPAIERTPKTTAVASLLVECVKLAAEYSAERPKFDRIRLQESELLDAALACGRVLGPRTP